MIQQFLKWLRPGLYVKRWLGLMLLGLTFISLSMAYLLVVVAVATRRSVGDDAPLWFEALTLSFLPVWLRVGLPLAIGLILFVRGLWGLNNSLLGPLIERRSISEWADIVHNHHQLRQGIRVVAIGGGTGMPGILRAMKSETSNITAVVTVADDGGSSGRLRRDLGMLPPGDLRNNIAALARDEDLMTQLLSYRFDRGELGGHTFGNLFLAALTETMGGMDHAVRAAGRVLAMQGQVLPCTLDDVNLVADVRDRQTGQVQRIRGESKITQAQGVIDHIALDPPNVRALPSVMRAIIGADLIVLGPGSLFTSLMPNLLVPGVVEAIRASHARRVYVCNIATQPGETQGFSVADHVLAIEQYAGQGLVDAVIANNHYPDKNKGPNTVYVQPAAPDHPINQRYQLLYTDLTDNQRPWRHSPAKLRHALLGLEVAASHLGNLPSDEMAQPAVQSDASI